MIKWMEPAKRAAAMLALSVLSGATGGCHNGPCKDPGVADGEQIQITVLAATQGPCTIAPLSPGDSFVLTGGATVKDYKSCPVVGASSQVPAFAASVLTTCREGESQLALDCTGMIGADCAVTAALELGPYLDPGVASIDHGMLAITWSGSSCNPGGCVESYDVRIDRLSAAR